MEGVDWSLFKEEIDIEKVIKITEWTLEKYGENCIYLLDKKNQEFDLNLIENEIDQYLQILKNAFYK